MSSIADKRIQDLEILVTRWPEDLDVRFAGVAVELASVREAQAWHTQRFSTLDRRLAIVDERMKSFDPQLQGLVAEVQGLRSAIGLLANQISGQMKRQSRS